MTSRESKSGFLKLALYIIAALVIVSVVLKVDLETISKNEQLKKNTAFVGTFITQLWKDYLSKPLLYFWNSAALGVANQAMFDKDGFKNPLEDLGVTPAFDINTYIGGETDSASVQGSGEITPTSTESSGEAKEEDTDRPRNKYLIF